MVSQVENKVINLWAFKSTPRKVPQICARSHSKSPAGPDIILSQLLYLGSGTRHYFLFWNINFKFLQIITFVLNSLLPLLAAEFSVGPFSISACSSYSVH